MKVNIVEKTIESVEQELIDSFVKRAINAIKVNSLTKKIFYEKFLKYYQKTIPKYLKIHTIITRDPIPLKDIYVQLDLGLYNELITRYSISDVKELLEFSDHIIIIGLAGTGKSTFMKNLFIYSELPNFIPVFIELRRLPFNHKSQNDSDNNFIQLMLEYFKIENFEIDLALFKKFLEEGKFVFFFDGFDEVFFILQDNIGNQINMLRENFPKNKIIISSRDRPLFAIDHFNNFIPLEIRKLTKSQMIELIRKIDFNEEKKNSFIKKLNNTSFFEENDFIRNPLLLTLMLIVYSEYSEIPKKLHLFFKHAYDVLFVKHNATKEGVFIIKPRCLLDIDEFEKILSGFSFLSYRNNITTFDTIDILDLLDKTKVLFPTILFDKDSFMRDMIEHICILIKDGNQYIFIHKTFQEYFSAKYLISYANQNQEKLFIYLKQNKSLCDTTIQMACLMNKEIIAKYYIIPILNDIKKNKNIDIIFNSKINKEIKLLQYIFNSIYKYDKEIYLEISNNEYARFLNFIISYYYNINSKFTPTENNQEANLILKETNGMKFYLDSLSKIDKIKQRNILKYLKPYLIAIKKIFSFEDDFNKNIKKLNSETEDIFHYEKTKM